MVEFDAEDVADMLHAKDAKNNLYVALIHGYQAGSDVFFYTSRDVDGILKKIGELFAAELEYSETLEYFIREADKDYFEVFLKVDDRAAIKRTVQVFSYSSDPFDVEHMIEPSLNRDLKRLLDAAEEAD